MTSAAYISCSYAYFSFELVTLTFGLLTLAMSVELRFTHPMYIPIFSILQLSVPELCVTQSDHTWNGHCACAASRDLSSGEGAKVIHIFEIPGPNLPIHFVTFKVLR